jgi:hypothetical protein
MSSDQRNKELRMNMYMLLYTGGGMPTTGEENDSMMNAWGLWLGDVGEALVDGNPFTPDAKRVSPDGAVADGPAGPMVSGYSLIKTGSMDDALGMAKSCPARLSGATISIFEVQ